MSTKDSKSIKAAFHREAIQKAAVINNPASTQGKSLGKLASPAVRTNNNQSTRNVPPPSPVQHVNDDALATINFTVGPVGDPTNDDYEGNKINRAKKNANDADIKMVADLDRWG